MVVVTNGAQGNKACASALLLFLFCTIKYDFFQHKAHSYTIGVILQNGLVYGYILQWCTFPMVKGRVHKCILSLIFLSFRTT